MNEKIGIDDQYFIFFHSFFNHYYAPIARFFTLFIKSTI
jgi:hypothetical protein